MTSSKRKSPSSKVPPEITAIIQPLRDELEDKLVTLDLRIAQVDRYKRVYLAKLAALAKREEAVKNRERELNGSGVGLPAIGAGGGGGYPG